MKLVDDENLFELGKGWKSKDIIFFNEKVRNNQIKKLSDLEKVKDKLNPNSRSDQVTYYRADTLKELYDFFLEAKFENFLYRGEAGIHDNPLASIHRLKDVSVNTVLREYYSEVGADLMPYEEKNFLFHAQHHGLPTPILDTTEILNTAVYFACNEDGDSESNFGILHVIKKGFSVDVSSLVSYGNQEIDIYNEYRKLETEQRFNGLFSLMLRQFEEANKDESFSKLMYQINNGYL